MLPPKEKTSQTRERLLKRLGNINLDWNESAHRVVFAKLYNDVTQHFLSRRFRKMQEDWDFIFVRNRFKLSKKFVARAEVKIKLELQKSAEILEEVVTEADGILCSAGVTSMDIDKLVPVLIEIKIFSADARRYLDLIEKFDHVILMLNTLVMHELLNGEETKNKNIVCKAAVRHVSNCMLELRSLAQTKLKKRGE